MRRFRHALSVVFGFFRQPRRARKRNKTVQFGNGAYTLTADQLRKLLDAAQSKRDKLMLRVLIETGVRRSELAALRHTDIDLDQRLLIVRNGKGGKLRVIPVSTELAVLICEVSRSSVSGFVFESRRQTQLSVRQINRCVAAAGTRAGLRHPNPERTQITCHLLRHTFARLWKANEGSIESLSKVLGHSSQSITLSVYGTESLRDVIKNYDRTVRKMFGPKT